MYLAEHIYKKMLVTYNQLGVKPDSVAFLEP